MPGFRNLLFDLDGTLVDSRETIITSIRHALVSLGLPADIGDRMNDLIGTPLLDIFHGEFALSRQQAHTAIDRYRDHYDRQEQAGTLVYPDIRAVLDGLAASGYDLYVATVKPTPIAEKVLSDLELRRHFKGVAGASMGPDRRDKSSVIAHALACFSLDPGRSVMIGDRDQDISGAHAHGLRSIGVSYGFGSAEELEEAGPDHIASKPADIPKLLATFELPSP